MNIKIKLKIQENSVRYTVLEQRENLRANTNLAVLIKKGAYYVSSYRNPSIDKFGISVRGINKEYDEAETGFNFNNAYEAKNFVSKITELIDFINGKKGGVVTY